MEYCLSGMMKTTIGAGSCASVGSAQDREKAEWCMERSHDGLVSGHRLKSRIGRTDQSGRAVQKDDDRVQGNRSKS